jgi:hypothetical protein
VGGLDSSASEVVALHSQSWPCTADLDITLGLRLLLLPLLLLISLLVQ